MSFFHRLKPKRSGVFKGYYGLIHGIRRGYESALRRLSVPLKDWSRRVRRKRFLSKMEEGDIILAAPKTLGLSLPALMYRLFMRSHFVHSMLYIGEGRIIHTTAREGVVIASAPRKVFKKDRYAVLRVKGSAPVDRRLAVEKALEWKGKKLDHVGLIANVPSRMLGLRTALASMEQERIWCSKLIYQAYASVGIELVSTDKAEVVTSEDLFYSPLVTRV
ncbi:MAG: hypothetical protein ACLFUP_03685 [Desulfobacteraceae bacterium]